MKHRTLTVRHLPCSHTAETISECLLSVLSDFGLNEKLFAIVADNAKNGLKIASIVNAHFKTNKIQAFLVLQFGCVCHIINLIVKKLTAKTLESAAEAESDKVIDFQDSSNAIQDFVALIKKCRDIASAFNRATQLNELLKIKQKELGLPKNCLIQEVEHRWNSMYLMIVRIYDQHLVSIIF